METNIAPRRTAVVTGASGGIGEACARMLGQTHRVALVARSADKLEALASEIGNGAMAFPCDLTQPQAVKKLADNIAAEFGEIDVLVNNAGTRPDRLLTTQPFAEAVSRFHEQLNANLMPAFLLCFALAGSLRRPGGRIVNIGSIAGQNGGSRAGSVGYAVAKAGVHALTLGLSRELAPQGITVNTVAPGFVAGTPFTNDWADDVVRQLVAATPTGRAGASADIADAVAYLASPSAGMMTAQCLAVNGGALPTR
jgi:3-oxoacyl-[acyl-carrier protein] reductase